MLKNMYHTRGIQNLQSLRIFQCVDALTVGVNFAKHKEHENVQSMRSFASLNIRIGNYRISSQHVPVNNFTPATSLMWKVCSVDVSISGSNFECSRFKCFKD